MFCLNENREQNVPTFLAALDLTVDDTAHEIDWNSAFYQHVLPLKCDPIKEIHWSLTGNP